MNGVRRSMNIKDFTKEDSRGQSEAKFLWVEVTVKKSSNIAKRKRPKND